MKTKHPAKNTHGGNRANAGANNIPKGKHKKEITVYIEQDYQDLLGGKNKLRQDIRDYVYNRVEEALRNTK